jgi:vacuolar-type H+-ATPase catalytic subunit A/Vma1
MTHAKPRSPTWDVEALSEIVVDCGYRLHVELGPGLLESVYEVVLAKMLQDRGLSVQRQVSVPIQVKSASGFCDIATSGEPIGKLDEGPIVREGAFHVACPASRLRASPICLI